MPLVTRAGNIGAIFKTPDDPANEAVAGDIWSDTNANETFRRDDADNAWLELISQSTTLYELFSNLSTIRNAWFVDFFAGAAFDNVFWSKTEDGSGTYAMLDDKDGGLQITTASAGDNRSAIDTNDIRQFNTDNCICVATVKATIATNNRLEVGFQGSKGIDIANSALARILSTGTNIGLATKDATTLSITDSDIVVASQFFTIKVEIDADAGTPDAKLTIDGVLKVTKTTNIPVADTDVMPFFMVATGGAGTSRIGAIRYMECTDNV